MLPSTKPTTSSSRGGDENATELTHTPARATSQYLRNQQWFTNEQSIELVGGRVANVDVAIFINAGELQRVTPRNREITANLLALGVVSCVMKRRFIASLQHSNTSSAWTFCWRRPQSPLCSVNHHDVLLLFPVHLLTLTEFNIKLNIKVIDCEPFHSLDRTQILKVRKMQPSRKCKFKCKFLLTNWLAANNLLSNFNNLPVTKKL